MPIGFVVGRATNQTNRLTEPLPQLNFNLLGTERLILPALHIRIFVLPQWCQWPINSEVVEPDLPWPKSHRIFVRHLKLFLKLALL